VFDEAKLEELNRAFLAQGMESLTKILAADAKMLRPVALKTRAVLRTGMPTFARVEDKLSENAVYDVIKAGRALGLTAMLCAGIYKAGKIGWEWYHSV
jgi:hypothetical protein